MLTVIILSAVMPRDAINIWQPRRRSVLYFLVSPIKLISLNTGFASSAACHFQLGWGRHDIQQNDTRQSDAFIYNSALKVLFCWYIIVLVNLYLLNPILLNIILLNVILLNIIVLDDILQNVTVPNLIILNATLMNTF
jgi:hypothetical protein